MIGGIGGQGDNLILGEEDGAVLPLLEDDEVRPEFEHLLAGADELRLAGQEKDFGVVEDQTVDLAQQFQEF